MNILVFNQSRDRTIVSQSKTRQTKQIHATHFASRSHKNVFDALFLNGGDVLETGEKGVVISWWMEAPEICRFAEITSFRASLRCRQSVVRWVSA